LGKRALFVSSIGTGERRVVRLEELSSVMGRSSRTAEDSWSRMIARLVPVFVLETNHACLPEFVRTDDASPRLMKGPSFQFAAVLIHEFACTSCMKNNIFDVTMTQTFLLHGMSIVELISPYKVVTHNYRGGPACRYTKMTHGFTYKEFSNR